MPRKQRIRARNMNSTALSMEGRTSPGPGSHCCPSSLALLRRKWQTAILFLAAMAFFLALALFSGVYFGSSQRSSAAAAQLAATDADVPVYGFVKVAEYPHDPNAFTQGLLHHKDDILFESTGMYGQSSVREVDLTTGQVLRQRQLARRYFGEGLTLWKDRLLQVLWRTHEGFTYDKNNFSLTGAFTNPMTDGWGLTGDGELVIGSDGTSKLYFIDPVSFVVRRNVTVKDGGREVRNLNELEYIKGEIWANVWQTDCIARVSPKDGHVTGWIVLPDLRNSLLGAGNLQIDVLNGIAWDSNKDRIFVTGKYWPKLYEIKLASAPSNVDAEEARRMCIN